MEQVNVKIQSVNVENCKNIGNFTAIFKGKSAHVSGMNGIGKSTLITALAERLLGNKPSQVVKHGERNGFYEMEMTDGGLFRWEFDISGKEKFIYTTGEGVKVKKDVLSAIIKRYFVNLFDMQKFLTTTEPAKRLKIISEMIKVDLSEIQNRYKIAFKERAEVKKELKYAEAQQSAKPTFEEDTLIVAKTKRANEKLKDNEQEILELNTKIQTEKERLNSVYVEIVKENNKTKADNEAEHSADVEKWLVSESEAKDKVNTCNQIISGQKSNREDYFNCLSTINEIYDKHGIFAEHINIEKLTEEIHSLPLLPELKTFTPSERPTKSDVSLKDTEPNTKELDLLLLELATLNNQRDGLIATKDTVTEQSSIYNAEKTIYESKLTEWIKRNKHIVELNSDVDLSEEKVAKISSEIKNIVSSAKLPKEFSIDLFGKGDILYKDFPITREQLASSAIYISAFKLAVFNLDQFKMVHFDISFLDHENRKLVVAEAEKHNIQLITESPSQTEEQNLLNYVIYE